VEQFPVKAFYRPAEVAEILGVSDTHVHALIERGAVDAVRISPRVTRISYGSLMALIGRPLTVTRSALLPEDVEAIAADLEAEEVHGADERLALR
jgi:excisionase family DNA binding protein